MNARQITSTLAGSLLCPTVGRWGSFHLRPGVTSLADAHWQALLASESMLAAGLREAHDSGAVYADGEEPPAPAPVEPVVDRTEVAEVIVEEEPEPAPPVEVIVAEGVTKRTRKKAGKK